MKRVWCWMVLLLVFGVVGTLPAESSDWTGNINLTLGGKNLDEDDWEPLEDHDELAVSFDIRMADWPVSIAMAISGSSEKEAYQGFDVEGKTGEFRIGIKKIWEINGTMCPFIGGGLAFMNGEVEGESDLLAPYILKGSDDDDGTGLWITGGIYWTLAGFFNLGVEVGVSTAEITLLNEDRDAGGVHIGLLAGCHW